MNKYKFSRDIWITFEFENEFYVGKTALFKGIELVACVSEKSVISYIHYSLISNPKRLKLIKDMKFHKLNPTDKKNTDLDFNANSN